MQKHLKLMPLLIVLLLLGITPLITHAQLTCDNPPAPFDNQGVLNNWQTVWDKMDVCIHEDNIFYDDVAPLLSGGIDRDGIAPLDNPAVDDFANAETWLMPQSPVIAVEVNDIARAYPLAILIQHEIVNDTIGDTAIAVTFCPLCNSPIVYDRSLDGQVLRMGVSGFLRNSNLIMWDDVTQSWWEQFTGEGIVGTYTGRLLDIIPSQLVSYAAFKEQYPDGEVLSTNGQGYGVNPFVNYDNGPIPFLFPTQADTRLFSMERVLGVNLDGIQVAYPFDNLTKEQVINDTVGDTDVVAFWQAGAVSALDKSIIDDSKDVGMAALFERNLNDQTLTFALVDGQIIDNETGSTWNIFGTATGGELAGAQLQVINAYPQFWFAWAAFYPDTEIHAYQPPTQEATERFELDPILGNPDAPLSIIEYGSYACTSCKFWHEQGWIDEILEDYEGQVNFIFRDMPTVNPLYDLMAAEVAQCALDQGNELFWAFHDSMYTIAKQGVSTRDDLIEIGRLAGLDEDALRTCAEEKTHRDTVAYDYNRGTELGVRGTPTFFINDQPFYNATPEIMRAIIDDELAQLEG